VLLVYEKETADKGHQSLLQRVASFPGSSPAFCRILYKKGARFVSGLCLVPCMYMCGLAPCLRWQVWAVTMLAVLTVRLHM